MEPEKWHRQQTAVSVDSKAVCALDGWSSSNFQLGTLFRRGWKHRIPGVERSNLDCVAFSSPEMCVCLKVRDTGRTLAAMLEGRRRAKRFGTRKKKLQ
jgi:hypothetical protein